ncbi:MAG TPA: hypothetical protein VG826_06710 [Pirellulales bacterium]|nr:hypothetical protein [Pirellulales bacterium]
MGIVKKCSVVTAMFHLPGWARAVVLAAAIETTAETTWAQGPQIPALVGAPGALSGAAEAAAFAHYLQMLKHFDQNGNGALDPNELALAKSGLGNLLGAGGNGAGAGGGNGGNLLPMFDRNGNGQLDAVEMQMAQMMMAMLMAGYSRPATGVPLMNMPDQPVAGQLNPPSQPRQRGRRKRAERLADFAKANNGGAAPMPAAPAKKNVKARGPMVERNQPRAAKGPKAPAAEAPANGR